jgi:hypothetical protein
MSKASMVFGGYGEEEPENRPAHVPFPHWLLDDADLCRKT